MSDRFYTPDDLAVGEYELTGPEAHHLAAVRRFGPGDRVTLFNGSGSEFPAEIIAAGKKSVILHISAVESPQRELDCPLIIASAMPKGDRADFLIEKLSELGVSRFIPLLTERSVVKPKDSAVEKFQRAVIEASKQCGRNKLMAVDAPMSWSALLGRQDLPRVRYVLHPGEVPLTTDGETVDGVIAVVGPEGGFTAEEISTAIAAGWTPLSLGCRVLRVETAAIAAAVRLGRG